MAQLVTKNRKSNVLTPSQLRCLSKIPTVNITSGCIHGCIYCYSKGYSQYPGDGSVILFDNTCEKLSDELARKRKKPQAVYFCPSCDPFQPVRQILDQTHKTMKALLKAGVGVQFVTKANVPADFCELFAKYSNVVSAQVGLTCVDDNIRKIFEPGTASVLEKLVTLRRLVEIGLTTAVRADPLILGVTDSDGSLSDLFSAISKAGAKEIAVSYLFLRPAIRKSLERNIKDHQLLSQLLKPYSQGATLPIGMKNSRGIALPRRMREEAFARIRKIALDFGLSVHICGCKNSDITTEPCHITRPVRPPQPRLFA